MNIFAIADLHLSGCPPTKPMDVFGEHWRGHWDKVQTDWRNKVTDQDLVLLAGDTSWGMRWDEAMIDLSAIMELPGQKVLIRGNHDYWWQTVAKMSKAVEGKLLFLQNSFVPFGQWAICGSRGWTCPGDSDFSSQDQAIYLREVGRVRLSLTAARQAGYTNLILMLHYPPSDMAFKQTGFTDLLAEFSVQVCIYGHLHGEAAKAGPAGVYGATAVSLVACDATNFTLQRIIGDNGRICDQGNE